MRIDEIPKTMRAVVYRGVDDLRIETLPVPRIGPNEVLVRVAACGVCPTDIKKIQLGTVPPPRVFGHETAGTIARVGALVRGFRVGDRVAVHHHIPCLSCRACRHRAFAQCPQYKKTGTTAGFEPAGGGFAEYVRVKRFVLPGLVKIPAGNTFEEGAMLEPVNTVLKAVRRLTLLPRDRVLVIGQGPIGLLFTRLLSFGQVQVVATDLLSRRLELGRRYGASRVVQAGEKQAVTRLERGEFDAVIVTVASDEAVRLALCSVRGGGQALLFAHTARGIHTGVELSTICVNEKDLIGSYSTDFTLQREVARLVFSRRLDVRELISHRFPLEEAASAIDTASRPGESSLKVFVGSVEAGPGYGKSLKVFGGTADVQKNPKKV
jgi:L-iditol 2-dehydrogenase